jgi:Zn-finger nucleic acid-binding protein
MLLLHFKEVEVDYCERCRGIWLDEDELETLLRGDTHDPFLHLLEQTGAPSTAARCLCPRCDAKLNEFQVNHLVLDRCPRGHGLWFDAGELRQLLAQSGASKTVAFLNDLFGTKPTTNKENNQP